MGEKLNVFWQKQGDIGGKDICGIQDHNKTSKHIKKCFLRHFRPRSSPGMALILNGNPKRKRKKKNGSPWGGISWGVIIWGGGITIHSELSMEKQLILTGLGP